MGIETLSQITIDVLRELASRKKELSADSLFSLLSTDTRISSLVAGWKAEGSRGAPAAAETKSETNDLEARLDTLSAQKNTLLKQLSEADQCSAEVDSFYKQALIDLIELLRPSGNSSLSRAIDIFKKHLKEKEELTKIQASFYAFRDQAVHAEVKPFEKRTERNKGGFFTKFLKTDPPKPCVPDAAVIEAACMARLSEAYLLIIEDLRLNLDKSAFERLKEIEGQVRSAVVIEELSEVRKAIVDLIAEYINRIGEERKVAAAFIREIANRLAEVEIHVLDSHAYSQKALEADTQFNNDLGGHMEKISDSVNFSKTLSELKNAMINRLAALKNALDQKREEDRMRLAETDNRMSSLTNSLASMKTEIDQARRRAKDLEQMVMLDPLTGIYNRRAYDRRIEEELKRFSRTKKPFSLIMFDVDHFKEVNDSCGHAVGDRCLKEIINRARPNLRKSDFLARFGGEEFIVLLPDTPTENAVSVAEKLRKDIEKTEFIHKGKPLVVTVSLGVTQSLPTDDTPALLFNRLDAAMYEAKNTGRNRVVSR